MSETVLVEKPVAFTVNLYLPGTTWAKVYKPEASLKAERLRFVSTLISSTAACGIAPPEGSVTAPLRLVEDCARRPAPKARSRIGSWKPVFIARLPQTNGIAEGRVS